MLIIPTLQSDDESSDDSESSSDASEDESENESDSDDDANLKKAAATKLPESGSSSDSDSSDSDSDSDAPAKKESSPAAAVKHESDSSVTLGKTSPELYPPLPPDPTTFDRANNHGKKNGGGGSKLQNEPFSRVPKNVAVEDKFRSNRFEDNAHGWGARAHDDLIVTKGKGFTKEKNKKKRGSYRGGAIDTSIRNGIKFED